MQTEQHIKIGNEFLNGSMYRQLCYYEAIGDHDLNITKGFCPQHTQSLLYLFDRNLINYSNHLSY